MLYFNQSGEKMELVMAPILAITDDKYRNVYHKHFPFFDYSITPFISLSDGNKITKRAFTELQPLEQKMKIVPQLLNHNQESFLNGSEFLLHWGYQEINLNLACPAKVVMNKGRGSGLLNNPEQIDRILASICPYLPEQQLSVKLRAGRYSHSEFKNLIPILNRYPLKKVIIHPRTAIQMYEEQVNLDVIEEAVAGLLAPITYSGDIFSVEDFVYLQQRFPTINSWMLGRGILINPFLPWLILGGKREMICKTTLLLWYKELFMTLDNYSTSDFYVLGRMKNIWQYFHNSFREGESFLKEMLPILDKELFFARSYQFLTENDIK